MSDTATRELRVRVSGDASDMGRMSNDVVRYLKAIEQNTSDTNRSIQALGATSQHTGQEIRSMGTEGSRALGSLARELGGLVAGLVSVGGAIAVVKSGFDFNSEIQQMQLGLAAIIASNETVTNSQGQQVEGAAKLAYAQGQVADVFAKLKQDAINTTATMPQLVGAFQQVLGPAMGVGMALDDARKVTVQLVQTMSAVGVPMEQAKSEINAIITGQMNQDTNLKNILKLSNEEVRLWAQKGTLAQELLERTAGFGEAGKQAGEIWGGAISNLGDNLQQKVLGPLTGEAFKTATDAVKKLNGEAFDDETLNRAIRWGVILNDGVTSALIGAEAVGRVLLMSADGWMKIMETGKRWSAEVGVNQAKKEMRGQALDRLGLNPMQRWELGWNTDAKDPSSLMLDRASQLGVSPEKRAQLAKSLSRIDQSTAAEMDRFDSRQSQGVMEKMAAESAKAEAAMAGKTHQFNTKGGAGGGTSSKLEGLDLAAERFDHGRMGAADFIRAARAEQAKFNEDAKEYWALQDKIDAALKKQADSAKKLADEQKKAAEAALEMAIAVTPELQRFSASGGAGGLAAAPKTRGGLGVSGESLSGGWSLGRGAALPDATFTGLRPPADSDELTEIAKNQALLGTGRDPLIQNIKAYRKWEKEEAEKWQNLIEEVAGQAGNLLGDVIRGGKGPSGGDWARAGSSVASMFGPYGAPAALGLNLIGAGFDRQDRDRDILDGASMGVQVDRKEYEEALRRKYSKRVSTGGSSGRAGGIGRTEFDQEGFSAELGAFDTKNIGRLMAQFEKGPEGDRHRSQLGLDDQVARMLKEGMPTEQIEAFKAAKNAEIEATYKAASALGDLQLRSRNVNEEMNYRALGAKLAGREMTLADLQGGYNSSGNGALGQLLGNKEGMENALTSYHFGIKEYSETDQKALAKMLGRDDLAGDYDGLKKYFESIVMPAFSQAADLMTKAGLGATKNIGMLNSDNPGELKFDAPQMGVTTIQQSNTWNIDGNVIGNPSAFEELTRRMGITIAVQGGQIA